MSEKRRKPPVKVTPPAQNGMSALLLQLMQQLVVLLLAVIGFLFCLISSYTLDLRIATLAWSAVAFSLLFLAVFSLPRSYLFILVTLALAGVYAFLNVGNLTQGLLLLVQRAITPLSLHLPESLQLLLKPATEEAALHLMTQSAQAILFVVSLLSAFFIISEPSVPGLALATLPLLLPAPFYLLSPALLPFFMVFAAHMMVFAFNNARRAQTTFRAGVYVPQSRRKANQLAQRAAQHSLSLLALPLIALAAIFSSIVLPQEGYQRPEAIESLQQKIFSLDIGKDVFWRSNDGLTRGDLKSLSTIRFTGATVLKVRVSNSSSLYLRDYAGATFSGSAWKSVPTQAFSKLSTSIDIAPQNLHASAAFASGQTPATYTLSVLNIAATRLSIWAPPGLVTKASEIPNAGYVQDTALAFASAESSSSYTLEAIPVGMALYSVSNAESDLRQAYQNAAGSASGLKDANGGGADQSRQAAERYIDFLFDVYTELPDDTKAAAETLLAQYGVHAIYEDGGLNLAGTCQSVRTLLSQNCTYDYSPPEIPDGADFATWFLQDAKSGYCVHFATTAAVLLRAMGIPARYAEGYIVIQKDYEKQPDAQGYIPIEDTHAHAWVEVFDPSLLEWVPVEMTKSAQDDSQSTPTQTDDPNGVPTVSLTPNTPEPTPEPTPTPTPEPTPEPTLAPDGSTPDPNATTKPDATPDEQQDGAGETTPTPAPAGSQTEDPNATPDGAGEGADENANTGASQAGSRPPLWPLFVILAVIGLPLGAFGWRKFQHERLLRMLTQKDGNAAVLACVKQALKMLRFSGAPELSPLESPEQYAYRIARAVPAVEQRQLESLLLISQRARFSGKNSTKRERDEAISFVATLIRTLPASMKRLKRMLFWWRFPVL